MHREGAAVCAQIGHAGPVADESSHGFKALTPSRLFSPLSFSWTRAATHEDIERVTRQHVQAARWAVACGFDAIELHFGHNYLASSFLSPLLNRRKDEYGGSLENRARVVRGIASAVRQAVGGQIAITAKWSMRDGVRGGLEVAESLQVARWLHEDGSLDALQLTAGSSLLNPMYLFRGAVPLREFSRNFRLPLRLGLLLFGRAFLKTYPYERLYLKPMAQEFRTQLDLPLVLLGGITDMESTQEALRDGFDFVAMGRALLAEPELPNRWRDDAGVRSACTHCNRCMPTIYQGTHCPELRPLVTTNAGTTVVPLSP